MYTSSSFEPFNHLLKTLLADVGLLTFTPVIAGGFPAALFFELKRIETPDEWAELVGKVEQHGFGAIEAQFGDIDFFFPGDSTIWQSEHRWLVSDYLPSRCETPADNPFGLVKPKPAFYNAWGITYVKPQQAGDVRYQLMRQPFFSATECIRTFDLMICCIAWHNGELVFHEDYEAAFDRKEIAVNPPGFERIRRADTYTHLFTSLRAFKYAERFGFTLSEELQEFVTALNSESRAVDLDSTEALTNRAGRRTSNPVPASPAFRGVANRFWEKYDQMKERSWSP